MGSARPFRQVELLGQGAQGMVWKCQYEGAADYIVVKEMLFPDKDRAKWIKCGEQAEHLRRLKHDHLIEYVDVFVSERPLKVNVVMHYYRENDMRKFIETIAESRKALPEFTLCSLVLQLARALEYLHGQKPPMIHRDVKPENVLMFDNCTRTLLMDLDTSREIEHRFATQTHVGTFEYMSPEAVRGEAQSEKSDIWSLGVVMLCLAILPEFLTLEHPVSHDKVSVNATMWKPEELEATIVNEMDTACFTRNSPKYSNPMKALLCAMLSHDPAKRPSAALCARKLEDVMVGGCLD